MHNSHPRPPEAPVTSAIFMTRSNCAQMIHEDSDREISDDEFWDDIPSDLMERRRRELKSE